MDMQNSSPFKAGLAPVRRVTERLRNGSWATRTVLAAILLAVLAGIVLLAVLLLGSKDHPKQPPAVVTVKAAAKDVTIVKHAIGTVVANATVSVSAQVTGQILRAAFQEGDIVKKGDLLFVIDQRSFRAALAAAKAQLAKDEAQFANALGTKKRNDTLFAQNAISSQARDDADASAKAYAATVAADRASVESAAINLGYTEIRSPVNGKTGAILIQPGNLVTANGSNPLVTITEIEPVKVSFFLPQSDLGAIQARARQGTLFALIGTTKAKVDFVGNAVSGTTGTIELRADIANRDHALVPGQLIDVTVALGTLSHASVVPREAVNAGPDGSYVFVVDKKSVAHMRPVTVAFDDGVLMAVTGIKPGETVIVDGQLRVQPEKTVAMAGKQGPAKASKAQ